jgi:sulfate transport system ATP-binding protein
MSIQVKHIRKGFGDFVALNDVSLDIAPGELVALLGPSGSGKTTLLRIIAGLEMPESGQILLEGKETTDKTVRERQVGFMFQHYALFKHMTVFENVAFGLRVRPRSTRLSEIELRRKVGNLLRLVHLDHLQERYPAQLSGGQRQRVALARALAVEPKVLLLDEPFGALDAKVRKELRRFMRRLHEEIHVTTIFVTHDQEEAMEVADRVVVMSNGAIEQVGTPSEVWSHPANGFVYDFLGNYNEFAGWKDANGTIHLAENTEQPLAEIRDARIFSTAASKKWWRRFMPDLGLVPPTPAGIADKTAKPINGTPVRLYARPHEMYVTDKVEDGEEYIASRIIHINPAGPLVKLELERPDGTLLQAEIPPSVLESQHLKKGMTVWVRPKQTKVFE